MKPGYSTLFVFYEKTFGKLKYLTWSRRPKET